MKEPIISNSTCLIGLERIGFLYILPALFDPFLVPPAVAGECGVKGTWLHIEIPQNQPILRMLKSVVDEGEAEAIALSIDKGYRLILDDRKARLWATRLDVAVIGTMGILILAKRNNIIPEIKPLINALEEANFFLSEALKREALHLVGE